MADEIRLSQIPLEHRPAVADALGPYILLGKVSTPVWLGTSLRTIYQWRRKKDIYALLTLSLSLMYASTYLPSNAMGIRDRYVLRNIPPWAFWEDEMECQGWIYRRILRRIAATRSNKD